MPLPTKVNVARPQAWGYDARLDYGDLDSESLFLRLALGPGRQLNLQTVDPQDRAPSVADNPEDMRPESGKSFSRDDFGGGEGLRLAHRRNGTDIDYTRFYDSRSLDVSPLDASGVASARLGHSFSTLSGTVTGNPTRASLLADDSGLAVLVTTYWSGTDGIHVVSNPLQASPTLVQELAGNEVLAVAELGGELYACLNDENGIQKKSGITGGTWAAWSTLGAIDMWAVKGRIIAYCEVDGIGGSVDGGLFEVAAGSASTLLYTLPAGEWWTDVIDAGGVILAASSEGRIYAFQDKDGTLTLVGQTDFEGEYVYSMVHTLGIIFVGTVTPISSGYRTGRLYRAAVVGNRIQGAQLLKEFPSTSTQGGRAVKSLMSTGRDVFFGVQESGATGTPQSYDIYRFSLTTNGLSHYASINTGTNFPELGPIMVSQDRLIVAASGSPDSIYIEDTAYVDEGWMILPLADFFTAAKKTWVGCRLQTGSMPAGTQVVVSYTTNPAAIDDPDHADWVDLITATSASPGEGVESPILGVESRYAALKVTLTPDGSNVDTPEVLSVSIRGLPMPTEEDFPIPVNVADRLELPGRKPIRVDGAGDAVYQKLESLVGKAVTLEVFRPPSTIKGQVKGISAPVQGLPERGSATVYALLTVRGQRQ